MRITEARKYVVYMMNKDHKRLRWIDNNKTSFSDESKRNNMGVSSSKLERLIINFEAIK